MVDGWGLGFLNDSNLTSVPSSLLMVILCDRGTVGTNVVALVLRLRPPGALDVDGVGGGGDMLMLADG